MTYIFGTEYRTWPRNSQAETYNVAVFVMDNNVIREASQKFHPISTCSTHLSAVLKFILQKLTKNISLRSKKFFLIKMSHIQLN